MSTSIESRPDDLVECCEFWRRGKLSLKSEERCFWSEAAAKVARVGVLESSCRNDGSWSCDCCEAVLGRGVAEEEEVDVVMGGSSLMGSSMSELTGRNAAAMVAGCDERSKAGDGCCFSRIPSMLVQSKKLDGRLKK